jgi:hypothetical protein
MFGCPDQPSNNEKMKIGTSKSLLFTLVLKTWIFGFFTRKKVFFSGQIKSSRRSWAMSEMIYAGSA